MASSTLQDVQREIDAGQIRAAARRLALAATEGEVEAMAELAHWRIIGDLVGRDLRAARDLLRQAGEAGDRESQLVHAYFLAAGVGGASDWAGARTALSRLAQNDPGIATQLRLVDAMDLGPDGFPKSTAVADRISERPLVESCRGLLSPAECDYLRDKGTPGLRPAVVVNPATGQLIPHPVRVSDGMTFGVYDEDLVINAINRRIAAFSGTALDQGEPLQLLRYGIGGEYRPHMDGIAGEPNQRILTLLVYLSDAYDGGETSFPRVGLSFRGRKGDALLFCNVDAADRPDPRSLHAGLPVRRGVKLIATRWIRRSRFVFPPPRPLLPEFG